MAQETEEQANLALNRHFMALANLEKHLPRLVGVGAKVVGILEGYCLARQLDPKKVRLGDIKAYGDATIAFSFHPEKTPQLLQGAAKGDTYSSTIKRMDAEYPQVTGMLFAIASQLVDKINRHRYYPKDVGFTTPTFFTFLQGIEGGQKELRPGIHFKILHKGQPLVLSEVRF